VGRSLVVDASVALKWVVTEPGSVEAAALLDEIAAGVVVLVAPEHLIGEVANGLQKRVAQQV
jgi:predicted nucleic acid-binding protein